DRSPLTIEQLDSQFTVRCVDVHEEVTSGEAQRTRGQRVGRRAGRYTSYARHRRTRVHRGETVAAQYGEPGAAHPRFARPRTASTSADIEVQFVADHHAAAAGRLDVAPVPRADLFRHRRERAAVRTMPVKAVAAEP